MEADLELIDGYCDWLETVRRCRPKTAAIYQDTLERAHEFLGKGWQDASTEELEAFVNRPRRGGIVPSPATVERDRAVLLSFWQWLVQRGHTEQNPARDIGVPKVRNRVAKAVPDEVWCRLWESEIPVDDRVWLGLMCFAGLRRQEVVDLAPEQVDPARGLLVGLSRKGGHEDTVEYRDMAFVLADTLPAILPNPDEWLSMVAMSSMARRGERRLIVYDLPSADDAVNPLVLNRRLSVLQARAGLRKEDRFSPHALRHTAVTNLLRCGVPIEVVSDTVGHTSIDTTRRYVKSAGRLANWRSQPVC